MKARTKTEAAYLPSERRKDELLGEVLKAFRALETTEASRNWLILHAMHGGLDPKGYIIKYWVDRLSEFLGEESMSSDHSPVLNTPRTGRRELSAMVWWIGCDGQRYERDMIQVVDDEFAEMVADHPDVIGIPYCFNSKKEVWPKPATGVHVEF